MESKPIASQKEHDQVSDYLARETAKVNEISLDEARLRLAGLVKSGIMEMPGAGPTNPKTQNMIAAFLAIPSSVYPKLI